MIQGLFLVVSWIGPVVMLFFVIYWAVRLAIRHEKRWVPAPREAEAQRRRARRRPEEGLGNRPDHPQ
jgi:hypothetical protein